MYTILCIVEYHIYTLHREKIKWKIVKTFGMRLNVVSKIVDNWKTKVIYQIVICL